MKTPANVDEYIAQAPEEWQPRLNELRATIKAAAPEALERISYGMPAYAYKGRLVYFQLWKKHIGLYGLTGPVLDEHKEDLEGYVMSKGTIQLPLGEELPVALISRLVKAQARRNDAGESTTPGG